MNYVALGIKTDYSLLQSLVKIDDLIKFALEHNLDTIGILDDNLFASGEFLSKCKKNNLKPIIGLEVSYNNEPIYLYAINHTGYKNLIMINDIIQLRDLTKIDLELYSQSIILVVPFQSNNQYEEFKNIFEKVYISYQNNIEKINASILTNNLVFISIVKCFKKSDTKLLNYLKMIKESKVISDFKIVNYDDNYLIDFDKLLDDDIQTTIDFSKLINLVMPHFLINIPKFNIKIDDSLLFLKNLSIKGLTKRLGGNVTDLYKERLLSELKVISEMGFVDYFLIVYDYVLYAKKNNIMVGPGRGSAASSLVAYSLGIIDVDPIPYNLLFERFLNFERQTMPDIDVDFEDTRRDEIKEYLKNKYGDEHVSSIITFSTLGTKQVLRDVSKILEIDDEKTHNFIKEFKSNLSLKENYNFNNIIRSMLKDNKDLSNIFKISIKIEGLKKQTSTHASGVVISSEPLNSVVPMYRNNDIVLTGIAMEYLEDFGLLKMDLLALNNLAIIHECLKLINNNLDLNAISLSDSKTFELFKTGNTYAVFQFDTSGMRQFLLKLKPDKFSDLYAAVALFRPGPMDNIDLFISRKNGKVNVDYLHHDLKNILDETYGVIVYQEQIIQILSKMAGYTLAESDIVRRSMSKKNFDLLSGEKEKFIRKSIEKNYDIKIATEVFDLILKFASYGFNKAHSVSYALISYQLAYLKANYPLEFMTNLLNMAIGSVSKTKECLNECQTLKIKILPCDIKKSSNLYKIENGSIRVPLTIIKGINNSVYEKISLINQTGYQDFFDFIKEAHHVNLSTDMIKTLIETGSLDEFKFNRQTMLNNLEKALNYADLTVGTNNSNLIMKPIVDELPEENIGLLLKKEIDYCGFYLSNHPAHQYYKNDMIKIDQVNYFFDKSIKIVVLIENIKNIKTKKNEDMAFISGSDETGSIEFLLFNKNINLLKIIKENNVFIITGKVTKKNDKYGIIINRINNVGE